MHMGLWETAAFSAARRSRLNMHSQIPLLSRFERTQRLEMSQITHPRTPMFSHLVLTTFHYPGGGKRGNGLNKKRPIRRQVASAGDGTCSVVVGIFILLFLLVLVLAGFFLFLQDRLPPVIDFFLFHVREDNVKHLAVPINSVTLNTLLDVLGACQ